MTLLVLINNAELVWRQSEILKDIDAHCKKIWKDADWDEAPTCSPQSKSFLICPSTLCSMMMKEGATWLSFDSVTQGNTLPTSKVTKSILCPPQRCGCWCSGHRRAKTLPHHIHQHRGRAESGVHRIVFRKTTVCC